MSGTAMPYPDVVSVHAMRSTCTPSALHDVRYRQSISAYTMSGTDMAHTVRIVICNCQYGHIIHALYRATRCAVLTSRIRTSKA
eukprot:2142176-Rhodomonas_salina.3